VAVLIVMIATSREHREKPPPVNAKFVVAIRASASQTNQLREHQKKKHQKKNSLQIIQNSRAKTRVF